MRSGHHRRTNDGVRQTVRKYYRAFMIAVLVLVSLVAVYSGEQALANYVTWSSQGQTPRRALLSETSEWDKAACSPIPADKTSGGSWDVKKCCDLPPPLKTDLAAWWNMCKDTDYLSGTPYLQCLEKWHDFDESKKSKNSGNAITSLKARCSDMGVYQQVGMKVGAAAYHPAMNLAYILTLLYLFVALAIVCDEYFVPAIELIQEEWSITPDVAGATIMAAGGSAPELATSFMGVFVSKSNVGFSTIVGSAVFNVLFVIGACAFASKTTLELSAWPLARDCSYYSMTLLALALVYMFGPKSPAGNGTIELYEAIVMLCIYIGYVTLMKWNEQLQAAFQRKFGSKQVTPEDGGENGEPTTTDAPKGGDDDTAGPASDDTARHWTTFRVGILDIILRDKPIDEVLGLHIVHRVAGDAKATFSSIDTDHSGYIDVGEIENLLKEVLHVEPTKEQIDEAMKALVSNSDEAHGGSSKISFEEFNSWYQATTFKVEGQINKLFSKVSAESGSTDTVSEEDFQKLVLYEGKKGKGFSDEEMQEGLQILKNSAGGCMSQEDFKKWALKTSLFKEESEGASLALPDDVKGLFFYILLFPVNATLYFTVPDVRWGGKWKKLYGVTFFTSIVWIAVYAFFMVWVAILMGDNIGIPQSVMGLTILAMGTSVPDMISSVIVTRQGEGDMAVSSSIGSNIFDIGFGLPLPWLLGCAVFGKGIEVGGACDTILIDVFLLLGMVVAVVLTIHISGWKMTHHLGIVMFSLYFVFIIQSLLRTFLVKC